MINSSEFRTVGHRLVDMMAEYLESVEERRLFPNVEPDFLHKLYDEPLPRNPEPLEDVIHELEEKLLPYCTHVSHPGYFGLITPTPTPVGILGDFLAAALNQNVGAYSIGPGAVAMERRTIRWLDDLIGYGEDAGGNLTSGGMTANFIGLKIGRDWTTGNSAQHAGLRGQWAAYVSEERHVSIDKAADAIGLGREWLRTLPTDDRFQLRVDALEEALARDRRRGIRCLCIVGLAGTTNTGSVDDLHALRKIADRERAWLHIDAAYGGGMLLSHAYPGRINGVELADSVTLDPHKWFYAPLDAGAILVKNESQLTSSFGIQPSYLTDRMDRKNERYNYYVHGFEQSRRFRSLKVWMSFKRYGIDEIGRWIDRNIEQAKHLYALCKGSKEFIPATEPMMSAVCIRYVAEGLEPAQTAQLHEEVVRKVEQDGRFWISTTQLKGQTWFRINPVNFRTRLEHMDALFGILRAECGSVQRSLREVSPKARLSR